MITQFPRDRALHSHQSNQPMKEEHIRTENFSDLFDAGVVTNLVFSYNIHGNDNDIVDLNRIRIYVNALLPSI